MNTRLTSDHSGSPSTRLRSLDALRGFDMFWILGADALVRALDRMGENPVTRFLATQLSHVEWEGFHFYDLIFPLFVFIAGVSLVWSLSRERAEHGRVGAARRVIRRGLLLVLLGIVYSGGVSAEWPNIRLLGVLQRIGLAYMGAGLLFLWFRPRALAVICGGVLVGYWALLSWVPIRDIQLEAGTLARRAAEAGDAKTAALFQDGVNPSSTRDNPAWQAANTMFYDTSRRVTGRFEKGYNVANHVDFQFLPGKRYNHYWDPEGLLSTLPAVATCLLGVLAGLLLRSEELCARWKLTYLVSLGTAAVLLGLFWGLQFPIVKKLWTSSFVLVAGGFSAVLLAGFYLVIDVWKFQRWCEPLVWIGMNSITIYLANNVLGFRRLAERFAGGNVRSWLDVQVGQGAGELGMAVTGLGLAVGFCWFLHHRKIFLRL